MRHQHLNRRCAGSSMVEMAIVVVLFFGLVFAIIEFALAVFYANRLIEATRAGARFAVVSAPLVGDLSAFTCATLPSDYNPCDSGNAACTALRAAMSAVVDVPVENIMYRYRCTEIGGATVAPVYSVSIKVSGMTYRPILPNLFIINNPDSAMGSTFEIDMPEFETTRTSEDQFGG